MKRLSNGRLNMAGVGTNTLEWGGCSGWYSSLSPALYKTPDKILHNALDKILNNASDMIIQNIPDKIHLK